MKYNIYATHSSTLQANIACLKKRQISSAFLRILKVTVNGKKEKAV